MLSPIILTKCLRRLRNFIKGKGPETLQNIKKDSNLDLLPWLEWSREDSKELILLYLEDYYSTLDDYFLERALHIAKEHSIDFRDLMSKVRFQLN